LNVKQNPSTEFDSNFWLTCITIDPQISKFTREEIQSKLEAANIECRPLWKPMHLQPIFSDSPFYGNNVSEDLFGMGLCLPSGSSLTDEDIQRVVHTIISK